MRLIIFFLLLCASVLYALKHGGKPERAVAAVLIFMAISDPLVHVLTPPDYSIIDPGHLIIDFVAWIAFFAIALRANRLWPLCISALQTISMISHIAKFLDYSIHPVGYAIMQVASSYPLLLILAIGTFNYQRRLRQNGSDPHWRPS